MVIVRVEKLGKFLLNVKVYIAAHAANLNTYFIIACDGNAQSE